MLDAVLRRGQTMDNAAQAARGLPPADAALASAIAGETLRRLPDLDALIDGATRQQLARRQQGADGAAPGAWPRRSALARPIMRWSRPRCRWSTAARAGWSTACSAPCFARDLPAIGCAAPARGCRGALARGLGRRRRRGGAPRHRASPAARPQLCQRRGLRRLSRRHVARAAPSPACDHAGAVTELPGFGEGRWWVQDLAASLPARLIPANARRVLDACAAPGGKTMQLAAAGHDVTALDRSESRLARLSDNLARTGLKAKTVVADALEWTPDAPFDAVLLDAPCSATGTFRRHPEVLYRARPAIIEQSAELQARLLARAADWVRPGGSLVYAVCSLEPQEGEERIDAFLAERPDFRLEPAPDPGRRRDATSARLAPRPSRHARERRRARRLLHRAPCPNAPNPG